MGVRRLKLPTEPHEAAIAAGLRYVTGRGKGISRRKRGKGFSYYLPAGGLVESKAQRERIRRLAIPPAWVNVWICPTSTGHLQASGDDERGRRQYIYHPLYRAERDASKFSRLKDFAAALPRIRRRVARDLRLDGLPRKKVLAAIVRLLDRSYVRIGNDKYALEYDSYGITTMLPRHLDIVRDTLRLHFDGKGGKPVDVSIRDARLVKVVKRCQELPGRKVFGYQDNGTRGRIDSGDVNDYLAEIAGGRYTAKDFRTWGGTTTAAAALRRLGEADSAAQTRRNIQEALNEAAAVLGNTPTTCRKYYVHPAILAAYESGSLVAQMDKAIENRWPKWTSQLKQLERGVAAVLEST